MKRRTVWSCAALLLACSVHVAWAGDGVAALQTADASCPDASSNIYVDCGNGTVTDNRTGLVWLRDANCLNGTVSWFTAMEFVAGLSDLPPAPFPAASHDCGLSDGSSPGEWRLPSAEEWIAMTANAVGAPGDPNCVASPPVITNDSGSGCWVSGPSSFSGVEPEDYWSSTTSVTSSSTAWILSLLDTATGFISKTNTRYVWPVRGGQ
ncbi:MAG: DUF1566 domain-containing protein [Thermoanaerobaculia bacterium]